MPYTRTRIPWHTAAKGGDKKTLNDLLQERTEKVKENTNTMRGVKATGPIPDPDRIIVSMFLKDQKISEPEGDVKMEQWSSIVGEAKRVYLNEHNKVTNFVMNKKGTFEDFINLVKIHDMATRSGNKDLEMLIKSEKAILDYRKDLLKKYTSETVNGIHKAVTTIDTKHKGVQEEYLEGLILSDNVAKFMLESKAKKETKKRDFLRLDEVSRKKILDLSPQIRKFFTFTAKVTDYSVVGKTLLQRKLEFEKLYNEVKSLGLLKDTAPGSFDITIHYTENMKKALTDLQAQGLRNSEASQQAGKKGGETRRNTAKAKILKEPETGQELQKVVNEYKKKKTKLGFMAQVQEQGMFTGKAIAILGESDKEAEMILKLNFSSLTDKEKIKALYYLILDQLSKMNPPSSDDGSAGSKPSSDDGSAGSK